MSGVKQAIRVDQKEGTRGNECNHVINYQSERPKKRVKSLDAVFDTLGIAGCTTRLAG